MRKFPALIAALCIGLALAGCQEREEVDDDDDDEVEVEVEDTRAPSTNGSVVAWMRR